MMTLHILNKSPEHPRFRLCLEAVGDADQLLLIENAVLALSVEGIKLPGRIMALASDLDARGVSVDGSVDAIHYDGMVALAAAADRVISW
ncbi:sulfurtransferase complex subunit TusB [Marinobacter sp. SS21]|uniref:sulfurtransferase complex subunit TusB n=1 Tax=Marinobacter sp. SS21 TaxID=2979460 RepID=UPI00232ADEBF|nr:sulfurtransferase complex subunit TusB [Marinobacter sp. SS21]MDC0661831.1 sulfurtransferase complex subunit TusB [Marinobacter sp. SS21]